MKDTERNSKTQPSLEMGEAQRSMAGSHQPGLVQRRPGAAAQLAHNTAWVAQLRAATSDRTASVQAAATQGVRGAGQTIPHLQLIQQAFGHHDVSGVRAHVGGPAQTAADAIGAVAYATGNDVAFRSVPDLHTVAHEAAHVVQQRAGVQLKGGVGEVGDRYEVHADAVADRVVRGESAEALLDSFAAGTAATAVQCKEEPVCGGVEGQKNKPAEFQVPPRPPSALWFKAEALRQKIDTPVHAAREVAESEVTGMGGNNLISLSGPIKGALSAIAAAGFNLWNSTPTTVDKINADMLQRKWELYVHCLGGYGYVLDNQYQIHDRSGRVVDTWWKDNWQ